MADDHVNALPKSLTVLVDQLQTRLRSAEEVMRSQDAAIRNLAAENADLRRKHSAFRELVAPFLTELAAERRALIEAALEAKP